MKFIGQYIQSFIARFRRDVYLENGSNLNISSGNIELGHATDTTIARSASGTVTIESKEIMTKNKKLHIIQTAFSDNMGTTEHFIPFNSVFESAAITNVNVPVLMPVGGKLLKVHMKTSVNHNGSSNTCTFKLYDVDNDEIWLSLIHI